MQLHGNKEYNVLYFSFLCKTFIHRLGQTPHSLLCLFVLPSFLSFTPFTPSHFFSSHSHSSLSSRNHKNMSVPETNNLSSSQESVPKKPKVLIVGGGLGGLFLGILLMKGGVDFEIIERAREVKPIGKRSRDLHSSSSSTPILVFSKSSSLSDVRTNSFPNLGSAMSMGACFSNLFKQIGIFDEFVKLGKPNQLMELFDENLNPLFNLDFKDRDIM